jgi:hypothetical protein
MKRFYHGGHGDMEFSYFVPAPDSAGGSGRAARPSQMPRAKAGKTMKISGARNACQPKLSQIPNARPPRRKLARLLRSFGYGFSPISQIHMHTAQKMPYEATCIQI